jgi:molybdenum cofactor biosynthesis enzyme MoaA
MDDLISRKDALNALTLVAKTNSPTYVAQYARRALKNLPAIDAVKVVFCKDCEHCRLLNDGVSFECMTFEMDFYAPTYDAATFYCADGKRRKTDDTGN